MITQNQSPSQLLLEAITRLLESGAVGVLVTVVAGDRVGDKILIQESGNNVGTLTDESLKSAVIGYSSVFLSSREDVRLLSLKEIRPQAATDSSVSFLFERLQPVPRLVVCGAGHVGAALARLGSFVGYHVTLIDDRSEFLEPERFRGHEIDLVFTDDWTMTTTDVIGDGRNVAVAVVTRGHNEDEKCMQAVTGAVPDYIGLIGSKRRTNIVIDRLREAGVSPEVLSTIRAPIGLDIGAVSPEEVALSIIAEIVAERRGAKGSSLSAWRRES
jgi:xanthine dehydrogenase accessory factor